MITTEKVERINELARKKKSEGLTPEEAEEQKVLRQEYVAAFRNNLKSQLDNIKIVDPQDDPQTWTPAEKENVAFLTDKLERELAEQNQNDEKVHLTFQGDPKKPTGEKGKVLIERMNESHKPLTDWSLDFYKGDPKNILDIGCGGGAALKNLETRYPGAVIYGIDYSPVSVETATEYNREAVAEGHMRIMMGSVSELPYGDDMFDLVISVESYFFWPDINEDMEQIRRVLKPGGTVLIIAEMYDGYEFSEFEKEVKNRYEMKFLSPERFEELYKSLGFTNVEVHTKEGSTWICAQGVKGE